MSDSAEAISFVGFNFFLAANGKSFRGTDALPGVVDVLEVMAWSSSGEDTVAMHQIRLGVATNIPTSEAEMDAADPLFRFPLGIPGVGQGSIFIPVRPVVIRIEGPFRVAADGRRIVLEGFGATATQTNFFVGLRLRAA